MLRVMLRTLLFRRPPAVRTSSYTVRRQAVTLQPVHFYRRQNVVRVIVGGCVSYACYNIYDTLVTEPLIRYVDREFENMSPAEKKELDEMIEADPSFFVPFPFTTTKIDAVPYKSSDPEWKKFAQINKDKALELRIRSDLADLVKRAVSNHPILKARIGSNMALRRYWLDIDYPYRPPPTFRRSGLLWDDRGLSWASEPIDSSTVQQMNKILWPKAMAQSSWVFATAMLQQHWEQVKGILGSSSPSDLPPSPLGLPTTLARSNLPAPGRQTANGTVADAPHSTSSKTAIDGQSGDAPSGGRTTFLRDMASHVEGIRQNSEGPWLAFRKKLAQTWKSTADYPPRGSIIVSGFVELESSRGFVVIDVLSNWNPETQKFDMPSTLMKVRRIQMKRQTPAKQ